MSNQSQCLSILQHLPSGKSINPLQAFNMFNCLRLSARIYDLKKSRYNIETKIIRAKNRKKYAEYSMQGLKK